jgi:hypothetical protein
MVYFEFRALDAGQAAQHEQIAGVRLRPARAGDMDQLHTLAQSFVPDSARWAEPVYRSLFDVSSEQGLADWLSGARHVWRVVDGVDPLHGAALLEIKRRQRRAQLHVWVVPACRGRYEDALIDSVLAELNTPIDRVVARVPGEHIAARVALTTRGFRQVRALTSMKLTLTEK